MRVPHCQMQELIPALLYGYVCLKITNRNYLIRVTNSQVDSVTPYPYLSCKPAANTSGNIKQQSHRARGHRVYVGICHPSYTPGCLNHETVELHGKIYVVGGVLGSNSQEQTMECYDHMTESWSSLAPPRQKRYNHCAVSLDEYIYVIGGNNFESIAIEVT